MTNIDDIISAAQSLTSDERARLIPLLWDKLNPDDWPLPSAAWIEEANRRSNQIDAGDMPTETWDLIRNRARKKAGLDG